VNKAAPSLRTLDPGRQDTVASTELVPSVAPESVRKPSHQSIAIQSYMPREEATEGNSLILFQSSEFNAMNRTPNPKKTLKQNLSVKEKLNFRKQWLEETSNMKDFKKMPSISFTKEKPSPFLLRL